MPCSIDHGQKPRSAASERSISSIHAPPAACSRAPRAQSRQHMRQYVLGGCVHQKRHRSRADSIHHRWRQIRLQIGNLQAALPSSPCRRAVVALRMKTGASLQLERVAHLMPLLDGSTLLHRVRAPVQSPVSRMDGCVGNLCSRSDLRLFVTFSQICASPGCTQSGPVFS